jgi:hypothetical protein
MEYAHRTNPYDGLYNGLPNIRGHHLDNIRTVYDRAYDAGLLLPREGFPHGAPMAVVDHVKEWVSQHGSSSMRCINWRVNDILGRCLPYGNDTTGFTEADADRFDFMYLQGMLKYVTMPPGQVVLISKYPDAICKSCHVGIHCDPRDPDNSEARILLDYLEYSQLFGLTFNYVASQVMQTTMGDIREYMYWKNLHERLAKSIDLSSVGL